MTRKTYVHNLAYTPNHIVALADVPNGRCKVVYNRHTGELTLEDIEGKLRPWWKTAIKRTFKHLLRTTQKGGRWNNKGADNLYHDGKIGVQHDMSAPLGYEEHEIARLVDEPTKDEF